MPASDNPSVTVSEIVRLALPTGSHVLAGETGLERPITWSRLLRARPSGVVEEGELLLLPTEVLASSGSPLAPARLIGQLVEAGVRAFVVAEAPDTGVREVCASTGTPLILVPAGSALVELERAVVSLIVDREAQLRRRAEEVYARLLAVVLSNVGLGSLVEALAAETGLRAAVFDDNGALLTVAPDEEDFTGALTRVTRQLLSREVFSTGFRTRRPTFLRLDHNGNWSGYLQPLQIGSALAGFLGLLGRDSQTDELNRLVSERAATLVALELAKQRAVAEATQRSRGEFLDDLLEWSFPSDEAAIARAQQLGYDFSSAHTAFSLAVDPSNEGNHGDAQLRAARQRRRFPEISRAALPRLEPGVLLLERDGVLIGLLPLVASESAGTPAVRIERLRAAITDLLPGITVSAGIGRVVTQPSAFADAQHQSAQALGVAQKLLGGRRTVDYARLGVERLLFHLLDNPALEQFAVDVLGRLLDYDAAHRGELTHTVEVFLRCNGNHVRAAQELHLHRNTLLYRLDRARQILGRDLEDAETRLALQVALKIRGVVARSEATTATALSRIASRKKRAG